MKLQQLVPSTGIPPAAPYQQASPNLWAAPSEVVAEGLRRLAGTSLRGMEAVQAAEDALKLVRVRSEARKIESGVSPQLDTIRNDLALAYANDPDGYLNAYTEKVAAVRDSALKSAMLPETRTLLEPRLTEMLAHDLVKAQDYRRGLIKSGLEANLGETVTNLMRQAEAVPLTDDRAFAEKWAGVEAAIRDSAPWKPAAEVQKLSEEMKQKALYDRARRSSDEEPDVFRADVERGGRWRDLAGKDRTMLLEHADVRIKGRREDEDRQRREAEAIYKEQVHKLQGDTAAEARMRFDAKTLTQQWLDEAVRIGAITPEKHEHFSVLLRKPPEKIPMPPEIARDLGVQVYDINSDPRAVQRQIEALVRANKIPYEGEAEKWLGHLEQRQRHAQERAENDAQRVKDKAERDLDRARAKVERLEDKAASQAEQALKTEHADVQKLAEVALRTTGPLEALSKEGRNAYADFLEELSRRSQAGGRGGKERPSDVWRDVKPRYMARIADVASERIVQVTRDLRGYQNAAEIRRDRAKLGEEDYYRKLEQLKELSDLQRELTDIQNGMKGRAK